MSRIVDYIYETNEYSRFKGTEDNRINIHSKPNTTKYKELKKAIEQEGLVMPILVKVTDDNNYIIIEGHHRFIACKELRLPIRFMITYKDLDTAILLSNTTNKWKRYDYIQRGLINEVPLLVAIEYEQKQGLLSSETDYMQYYKLILSTLPSYNNKFPSEQKVFSMLEKNEGIRKLQAIQVNDEDINEIRHILQTYLELRNISLQYLTEEEKEHKLKGLQIGTHFINAFSSLYYKAIAKDYEVFKASWLNICKNKNKKNKDIYVKMTSSDERLIKQAIMEISYL